ncbi:CASP-like protein 4A2 [Photinus pyralis]|uniref:CASP-like protein 4A2 n=1 Tax=Photinus pyralis TaxID=7054 RepID=UPI0012671B8D|nr:CASP-like protein 4A2 [Photinus pyralis]XP_031344934.1 CASP-like protein 4A2 [Photinus pyralis]XP_031354948.1 CASP-like protein 4A2 [Photinus pyralis]
MPRGKKSRNVNEPERPKEPPQEENAIMVPPPPETLTAPEAPIPPPEALIPPPEVLIPPAPEAMEVPAAAENPWSNILSSEGVRPEAT